MKTTDERPPFAGLNGKTPSELFGHLPTPCYIIDEAALVRNGGIMKEFAKRTGVKLLLAQKAFSNFDMYSSLAPFLDGTEASGLYEARLGAEELPGREVHVYCAAYREEEFDEILAYADHIVFNSPRQLKKFGAKAKAAGKQIGLRINPECSTQEGHAIYDPCAPGSRLGTTGDMWEREMTPRLISMLDGLHFHTLCEQNSDALEATLRAVKDKFDDALYKMKWINFGGGHHITRDDYDMAGLERCVRYAVNRWDIKRIYLEPGEAWALNAGYLASRVLDVFKNGKTNTAVIDASAACHMPDVLEMPYHPPLYGETGNGGSIVRLGGPTCLAGDVIGDFGFEDMPSEGQLLLFGDMAIYTMCKNNTFNGIPLPPVYAYRANGRIEKIADFDYYDFKNRLGNL